MFTRDYLSRSQLLLEYLLAVDMEGGDTENVPGSNAETAEHELKEK